MKASVQRCSILGVVVLAAATVGLHGASADLPVMDGVPTAEPEAVGMSSGRLERLDRVMRAYIDREEVAGVVTLVARRGKVVNFSAQGHRDVEGGKAMTHDTIFRMASMTKPIASVALMMLYEEGRFQLRDPISKWLPEFADMQVAIPAPEQERLTGRYKLVPAARPITVQHVLTHTAGLANTYRGLTQPEFQAMNAERKPHDTVGDMVERLAKLPLNFHPGDRWEYGRATDVVGRLVEVMSGKTLDAFFRERIFGPLDMPDTHFYLPKSKLDRFAALYGPNDDGKRVLTEAPTADSRFVREPHVYFSGAGGLVSTARDYFRFHQMMLNGGELDGVRILSRKTIELMTANHTGDFGIWLAGPGYGFGLGYAVVTDLGPSATPRSEGSYYWGGAFGTIFWVDPSEELIGIMLTQMRPYTHLRIRDDLATMTYQAIVD
ncbi:MAG: beta-lactamase family protein [Acidobacteria bacterium]|nr:beta-lactamase family protein [Acidobacteriota bacterium]